MATCVGCCDGWTVPGMPGLALLTMSDWRQVKRQTADLMLEVLALSWVLQRKA
jgi:hypothetical protein